VTHDQEEALTMSDRIAVMNGGQIEQLGTPEDLYDRPATRFVAGFIGTTNLLSGTVVGREGGVTTVRLANGELTGTTMNGLATGQPVELCVRPEAVTLRPGAADGAIAGQIEQAAFLGTTIQYLVRTAGGEPLTVLAPKAGGKLPVGADVAVSWSPDEARVLGGDASGSQEEAPG
jgi:spermidine/putrescine transport system ATP-binding protein